MTDVQEKTSATGACRWTAETFRLAFAQKDKFAIALCVATVLLSATFVWQVVCTIGELRLFAKGGFKYFDLMCAFSIVMGLAIPGGATYLVNKFNGQRIRSQ